MFYFKGLLVLSTCLSWSYCKLDRYCSICEDHTLCKYSSLGEDCEDPGEYGVSSEEKNEILALHNWYRRLIATGYETRGVKGPQPKAANMMKFIWDDEMAAIAQRWADQCKFAHDTCRNVDRWRVGQNIYWKWKYPVHNTNWTEAIASWYGEVTLYNPDEVESYRFDPSTGHYTQLIWHETYAVGCGRRDYGPNKLYICNYGPAGNWIGSPMYTIGEPCSKCPAGTFCDDYLCTFNSTSKATTPKPAVIQMDATTQGPTKTVSPPTKHSNQTKSIVVLKPPVENVEDVYESEVNKTKNLKKSNQTHPNQLKPDQKADFLELLLRGLEQPKFTSMDENQILLDPEIRSGLEEIKIKIEKLLRKAIIKLKAQC